MTLDGQAYAPRGPKDAEAAGHRVHPPGAEPLQEPDRRGEPLHRRLPEAGPRPPVHRPAQGARAGAASCWPPSSLDIPPGTPLSRLSQGERQLVEIAKALGAEARIVIFDEPTTSLTARESERLFALIGRLKAQGIAVIYISHILRDVMRLCDQVTVLRDGRVVGQAPHERAVGRPADHPHGRPDHRPDLPAARDRPGRRHAGARGRGPDASPGSSRTSTFSVRPGEVLGVSGLMGSGPLGDGPHPVRARPLPQRHDPRRRQAARAPDPAGGDGPRHRLPDRGPAGRGPADGRQHRRQHRAGLAARVQRPLRRA